MNQRQLEQEIATATQKLEVAKKELNNLNWQNAGKQIAQQLREMATVFESDPQRVIWNFGDYGAKFDVYITDGYSKQWILELNMEAK